MPQVQRTNSTVLLVHTSVVQYSYERAERMSSISNEFYGYCTSLNRLIAYCKHGPEQIQLKSTRHHLHLALDKLDLALQTVGWR